MAAVYNISSRVIEDYFAVLAAVAAGAVDEFERNRELMQSYAEFKYRVVGGSHCAICNAHVRHVLQTIILRRDGEVREFACLCTRCVEGEKSQAERMFQQIGENRVEVDLRKKFVPTVRTAAAIAASLRAMQAPIVH